MDSTDVSAACSCSCLRAGARLSFMPPRTSKARAQKQQPQRNRDDDRAMLEPRSTACQAVPPRRHQQTPSTFNALQEERPTMAPSRPPVVPCFSMCRQRLTATLGAVLLSCRPTLVLSPRPTSFDLLLLPAAIAAAGAQKFHAKTRRRGVDHARIPYRFRSGFRCESQPDSCRPACKIARRTRQLRADLDAIPRSDSRRRRAKITRPDHCFWSAFTPSV